MACRAKTHLGTAFRHYGFVRVTTLLAHSERRIHRVLFSRFGAKIDLSARISQLHKLAEAFLR